MDFILALFYLTFIVATLCRLAVALMPQGAPKKRPTKAVVRLLRAYVFGGLLGAVCGAAMCPDHFSTENYFRFISVYALLGVVLWWLGSLAIGSSEAGRNA